MSEPDETGGTPDPRLVDRRRVDWRQTHLWQIQPIRDVLVFAAVFGVLYLGYVLSPVTVPMLLAIALAYLFEPVVQRMTRHPKITREGSAMIIIVAAAGLLFLPLVIGGGFAFAQANQFINEQVGHIRLTAESREFRDGYARWGKLVRTDKARRAYEKLPENIWREVSDQLVAFDIVNSESRPVVHAQTVRDVMAEIDEEGVEEDARYRAAIEKLRSEYTTLPAVRFEEAPASPESTDDGAASGANRDGDRASPPPLLDYERFRTYPEVPEQETALTSVVRIAADWFSTNSTRLGTRAVGTGVDAAGAAFGAVTSLGLVLFSGFLTAFFFYFFSTGYPKVVGFLRGLLPEKYEDTVLDLTVKMDRVISGFIRGRIIIAFILGIVLSFAYYIVGVPMPLLVGFIIGILSVVPYVSLIGIPITIGLMLIHAHETPLGDPTWREAWWWEIGGPLLAYFLAQTLDDYVLTPKIQGKSTGMDTPTILFASLAGGILGGLYGVLLAIPVAACIKILLHELFWPNFKAWAEGRQKDFLPFGRD